MPGVVFPAGYTGRPPAARGAAEDDDRAGVNSHLATGVQRGRGGSGQVAGVARGPPGRPGAGGRDGEVDRLPPGVDQDEELVVEHQEPSAARAGLPEPSR